MAYDEKMTIDERGKYIRIMRKRYERANRRERSSLLDEMEQATGLHRKSLIRLVNGDLTRKPRRHQRRRSYGPEVDDALRVIDESFDIICPERLVGNLTWMATHLAAHGELDATPILLEQLSRISVSTLRRIRKRIHQDQPRLPQKGPEQANRATRDIPMKRLPWDETEPGSFEVDLVHHCGPSASGEYVHTIQMIDVATGWSERTAVLGRSQRAMEDGFRRILARLPFPVREIHPDNGSEFFNHHLLRFWRETVKGVRISRSRPYRKNDNRFVEQKNSTLVRKYLGDERLDSVAQTLALNELYDLMWLYYNFFQPVMRLSAKTTLPQHDGTSRVKRSYDESRTPFHRLCATNVLSDQGQEELEQLRDRINPRQLRRQIYDAIDSLFALPNAVPEQPEDVHLTLTHSPDFQKGDAIPVTFSLERTISLR